MLKSALVRLQSIVRYPFDILKTTIAEWHADRVPRIAAALAYHTLIAIAPLLIVAVGIAGLVLGRSATRDRLTEEVLQYTGSAQIAGLVQTILDQTARPAASTLSTAIGALMLLWGASNLFSALKSSLNDIWNVPPRRAHPVRHVLQFLINRGVSLLMVIATGILLLASTVLTPWLATVAERLGAGSQTQVAAQGAFYLLTLLIFAFNFRYLPDIRTAWRYVLSGAAVTALLFAIGRHLIGMYLSYFTIGSAYGAAGSLIVVLLWLYYSAQIFFFGAELTQVISNRGRPRSGPDGGPVPDN